MKKILKTIITASFVLFACIFMYACNPDATVSKSQWEKAFSYESKFSVVITNSKIPEFSTKVYIQEKMVKVEDTVNNITTTTYYVENGESYWKYTYNQEYSDWNVEEIQSEEYQLSIQLPALEDLSYDNFWYIYAKDYYKATDINVDNTQIDVITVKFNKSNISEIVVTDASITLTYKFDYSTDFNITLPGQGGGQPSETNQVTEAEWNAAFVIEGDFTKTSNGQAILSRDGNRYKVLDGTTLTYYDFDGVNYWQYWYDEENTKKWTRTELGESIYNSNISALFLSNLKFSDFAYNEQSDEYIATNLEVESGFVSITYQELVIKFKNKKLERVSYKFMGLIQTEYYSYGDITINLPTLGESGENNNNGPLTKQEWDTALNFSNQSAALVSDLSSIYRDGNKTKMVESGGEFYFEFDGQNYYSYIKLANSQTVTKLPLTQSDYEGNLSQFDWSKTFTFESFTYDETNQIYKAVNYTTSGGVYDVVTIKFDNKKAIQISTEDSTSGKVTMAISYDPAVYAVTLPAVEGEGGDQESNEVSFAEWYTAFEIEGDFSITVDNQVTVCRDGNKYKSVTEMDTIYYDYDGQSYWKYSYNGTNQKWTKSELNESTYKSLTSWLVMSGLDYSDFTYDDQNRWYKATNVDVTAGFSTTTYSELIVKFQNKKISYIKSTILDSTKTENYSYDDVTITLPTIEGEGLAQQEWNNALNFCNQNVSLTLYTTIRTNYAIKDGNKMKIISDGTNSYYDFDGTNYYLYKQVGTAKAERSNITKADYDLIFNDFDFSQMFVFSSFEHDQVNNVYNALNYTLGETTYDSVQIKFTNKQLEQIILVVSNSQEAMFASYNQEDYQITLPEFEENNSQITEQEWKEVLNLTDENVYLLYDFKQHNETHYMAKDGNKIKFTDSGVDYYYDYDGIGYYLYCVELGFPAMKIDVEQEEYMYMLTANFDFSAFNYSDFTYDPDDKMYKASNIVDGEYTYSSIILKFENKKLIEFTTVDDIDGEVVCNCDYREESYKITLPEVEDPNTPIEGAEQVSETEWSNAFANTNKKKMDLSISGYPMLSVIMDGDNIKSDRMGEVAYFTRDSSNCYKYTANGETGYTREVCDQGEYIEQNILAMFGQMFSFSEFSWVEDTKTYYEETISVEEGVTFRDVNITFAENKVAKITMTIIDGSSGSPIELVVDYSDSYTVTLP